MLSTAAALGLVIGASLGLLGGGGSILTVPIFVYILGFPPKDAIAMSLAVVGVTSVVGALGHWRAGHVNLKMGAVFGVVAMVGSFAGTRVATYLSGALQLAIFGAVMLVAAVFMFRRRATSAPGTVHHDALAIVAIEALAVGLLTGVVGVGGGFLIVPALVLLEVPMGEAVGTSLLIIAFNCVVGFYGYLGRAHFAWESILFVTAGTLPGIALGTWLHRFTSQEMLRRSFAVFLLLIATFILYENVTTVLAAFSRRPS